MREPWRVARSVTSLLVLTALMVWADLGVSSLGLKVALLVFGTVVFSVFLVESRLLSPNRPRQLHGTFSLRDRPWWTFGAVLLVVGIIAIPAVLIGAIGQTGVTPIPRSWWDVVWIIGVVLVAGLLVWVATRFSGAKVVGPIGQSLGKSGRKGLPAQQRATSEGLNDSPARADAVVVPALVLLLVARLEVALGPEFGVATDESGHSIVVTHQGSACRVDLPFGRFRLLPVAEAVCLTCRYTLGGVQQFVSASLGYDWPHDAPGAGDQQPSFNGRATPTVTERDGLVMLEWRTKGDTVLALSPIALSDLFGPITL